MLGDVEFTVFNLHLQMQDWEQKGKIQEIKNVSDSVQCVLNIQL